MTPDRVPKDCVAAQIKARGGSSEEEEEEEEEAMMYCSGIPIIHYTLYYIATRYFFFSLPSFFSVMLQPAVL